MSPFAALRARALGIPLSWKIGAAAVLVAALAGAHLYCVNAAFDAGHKAAVDQRAARDGAAILTRVQENQVVAFKQDAINAVLTKVKNEELAPVARRIAAERVRVGPAICGPATAPQTEDAAGSDGSDPPGRPVRADIERDLRALKLAVEQDLATGRACQAWGRKNGFVP